MNNTPISQAVTDYASQEAAPENLDTLLLEIDGFQIQIANLQALLDERRSRLKNALELGGRDEYKNDQFTVKRIAKAGKVSLKVPVDLLPTSFTVLKPNDVAIRKAAAAGQDVTDFVTLEEPSYYVRITGK